MRMLEKEYSFRRVRSRWISTTEIGVTLGTGVEQAIGLEVEIRLDDSRVQRRLNQALRTVRYNPDALLDFAEQQVAAEGSRLSELSSDSLGMLFLLSILLDLKSWGTQIDVHNSTLVVRNFHASYATEDHQRIRGALQRLKAENSTYQPPVSETKALDILLNGNIELAASRTLDDDVMLDFRRGNIDLVNALPRERRSFHEVCYLWV